MKQIVPIDSDQNSELAVTTANGEDTLYLRGGGTTGKLLAGNAATGIELE